MLLAPVVRPQKMALTFIKKHLAGIGSAIAVLISLVSAFFAYQANQLTDAGSYKEFWTTVRISATKERELNVSLYTQLQAYIGKLVIARRSLQGPLDTKAECDQFINGIQALRGGRRLIQNSYQQYYWYTYTELAENRNAKTLSINGWDRFTANRAPIGHWVDGMELAIESSSFSIAYDGWLCGNKGLPAKQRTNSIKLINSDFNSLIKYETQFELYNQPVLSAYTDLKEANE